MGKWSKAASHEGNVIGEEVGSIGEFLGGLFGGNTSKMRDAGHDFADAFMGHPDKNTVAGKESIQAQNQADEASREQSVDNQQENMEHQLDTDRNEA